MKSKFKVVMAVMMAFVMVFALCACSKDDGEEIANPIHESDQAGVLEATGFDLVAPEGATDVSYSYIDSESEDSPIAQMDFTLDGKAYEYRAQSTSLTSLGGDTGEVDEDATIEDIQGSIDTAVENGAALSGYYEEWSASATVVVQDREAVVAFNKNCGFIAWIDPVPGVMYSVSMSDGATQADLEGVADKVFVPVQGEN